MPAPAVGAAERMLRRSRSLSTPNASRRGELVGALAVALLLAHLLFAQLTLALTVAFWATAKMSRWRPLALMAAAAEAAALGWLSWLRSGQPGQPGPPGPPRARPGLVVAVR